MSFCLITLNSVVFSFRFVSFLFFSFLFSGSVPMATSHHRLLTPVHQLTGLVPISPQPPAPFRCALFIVDSDWTAALLNCVSIEPELHSKTSLALP